MTRVARRVVALLTLCSVAHTAHAIEARVTARALERTLKNQLFKVPGPPGEPPRYYLRGKPTGGCAVYADTPEVSFVDQRVVVHIHTHAAVGASVHGRCIGLAVAGESIVSFIPEAQGESIGFRDARMDRLTDSKELDLLLVPFLSKKLPAEMKVNAAEQLRTLLVRSPDSIGYTLTLTSLKIHSMVIEKQELVLDLDADLRVD